MRQYDDYLVGSKVSWYPMDNGYGPCKVIHGKIVGIARDRRIIVRDDDKGQELWFETDQLSYILRDKHVSN